MDEDGKTGGSGKKPSAFKAIAAVAWSFLGVRKSSASARDDQQLNPIHLALAALALAGVFVGGLIVLVQWIIQSGVAK